MQLRLKKLFLLIFTCLMIPIHMVSASNIAQAGPGGYTVFLPAVVNRYAVPYSVRINAPYFSGNAADHFSEAAVTWFGKVSSSENYADLRIAYDNNKLWVYLVAFDRYMWFNQNPTKDTLTQWDSATLLLNMSGNTGNAPESNTYRFVGALHGNTESTDRKLYQASYRGNGSGWSASSTTFTTIRGFDGFFNGQGVTRGWAMTFEIPFTSLGISGAPSDGTLWGIGVQMHDRDSSSGPALADKNWPDFMTRDKPSSWAQLRFGLPAYGAIAGTVTGSDLIREDSSRGISVPDAGLGGTIPNLCPGDENYIFNSWGNANFGSENGFNIQNQSKITDWPCFSKYYVTFPLTTIPTGKNILSAKLILHQWGGAGDKGQATPSLIQVLTIKDDWSENSITWNNAPQPLENVSQNWVGVYFISNNAWPGARREWDVTYAAMRAYESGQPLRLALYEADSDYHSGKYFTSSESGSWNIDGRPSLDIKWGN